MSVLIDRIGSHFNVSRKCSQEVDRLSWPLNASLMSESNRLTYHVMWLVGLRTYPHRAD